MGSNGSVIPFFLNRKQSGVLPITEPTMTRFTISLADGVKMVLHALEHAHGGELYVPKIPSYRITDLAEAIGPECEHPVIGIRPGEKIHEEMITSSDSFSTYVIGDYYVILPQPNPNKQNKREEYLKQFQAKLVPAGFNYNSGDNDDFLTVEALRQLIKDHVDPEFEV
jgi:FlaA1/EpsC-like NDP-sugar epimerase